MDERRRREPVAIVGAGGQIGAALLRRLEREGLDVRAVDRGDDLRGAVRDAASVVHLAGALAPRRPNTFERANLQTVERTSLAIEGSSVRRVIFLSFPGADPHAHNAYLRTKGAAEELLRAAPVPAVIVRSCHVIGTPAEPGPTVSALLARGDHPVSVLGTGQQRWSAVARDDVVEVLASAALDFTTPVGTFELGGPATLTVDELVDRVNGRTVRKRHLHGAAADIVAALLPSLHRDTAEILAGECIVDGRVTAAAFGVRLHSLDETWPRVGSPTSVA